MDVGAGERKNAALSLDFLKKLDGMVASGEVVYDNGEVKVVRLNTLAFWRSIGTRDVAQ